MPNCEDCIHWEACKAMAYAWRKIEGTHYPLNAEKCEFFKDRSKFVELPCKVGDILYHPVPLRNIIAEYKIKSFQIYSNFVWVNWNLIDGVATINFSGIYATEIGKTVFLSKEKAEQALKEREKDEAKTSN